MPTRKQLRLNDLLREELSLLIPGRLDDPRLVDAVVTRVETTQDMATAKVYITGMSADDDMQAILSALVHAESFLRAELADLGLRRLPHLVFARDRQHESAERVLELLEHLEHVEFTDVPEDGAAALPADDDGGDAHNRDDHGRG